MQKFFLKVLVLTLATVLPLSRGYASTTQDQRIFQELFNSWTHDFNKKNFPKVCGLFSKDIVSDYQGSQKKNYSKTCNGFQKIFQEKDMSYRNSFKIHQIYRSNDLAAVRITWYLNVYKKGKHISLIQEEGLDILQKQANGEWKIVNFIAYPVKRN